MMFSIVQTIAKHRELTVLANALHITNLDRLLDNERLKFTIFAPNNLAFATIAGINLKSLTRDKDLLTEILNVHIVEGKLEYCHLLDLYRYDDKQTTISSLDRSPLTIDLSSDMKIGNARVLTTNISASNGIIHIIDRVLYLDNQPRH